MKSTQDKTKMPFWIKKKYIKSLDEAYEGSNSKTNSKTNPKANAAQPPKTKKKKSILRNTPFRDIDKGLMN